MTPEDWRKHRIENLLTRPIAWGPPNAVECQFLLMVELGHVIRGAEAEHVFETGRRWVQHTGRTVKPGPQGLAEKLGFYEWCRDRTDENNNITRFAAVCRSFIELELPDAGHRSEAMPELPDDTKPHERPEIPEEDT